MKQEVIERTIFCTRGHTVKVLRSAAGYYIGTLDEDGLPHCRVSRDYYKYEAEAKNALTTGEFVVRGCVENIFCSGGVCF